MSMFRRPTDDSSDSDSSSEDSNTEELDRSNASTDRSNGTEDIVGADLTRAGTFSSGESISFSHSRDEPSIGDSDQMRNMMLASLLEDFYRTRAAELFNTANPGANFHRQSPEIQPLARSLFTQASQALSSNGLLSTAAISSDMQSTRGQYLNGFDNFGLQNIERSDLLFESMKQRLSAPNTSLTLVKASLPSLPLIPRTGGHPIRDLAFPTERLSVVPHPANDMQLSSVQQARSHYKSSFQEVRLLGKGGFGRVYQTYNVFDKREYAVKKIPLSAKLSQQYREQGHTELTSVLREVQALAQLDHCNVVRYHATWLEDPAVPLRPPDPPMFKSPFNQRKLITDSPTVFSNANDRRRSSNKSLSQGVSDGIEFEADSADDGAKQHVGIGWSHNSHVRQLDSSFRDSDIFTDGMTHNVQPSRVSDDPSCYVLHVQMSMYPTTLAQYLSTAASSARRGSITASRRHCFHLVPALRILLGILCGLQYIHTRGFVHRDIKPSNIFISNYDVESYVHSPEGYYDVGDCPSCLNRQPYYVNPRIGDFGLVADLARDGEPGADSKSSSNSAVGTEYYRPPTGNKGKSARVADEKLDVYALGVIFVEMLWCCGTNMERLYLLKNVQKGIVPQEIAGAVEAEGHCPGTGKLVGECISGMVEKDHALRWSCSKVKTHLEEILARCYDKTQHQGSLNSQPG